MLVIIDYYCILIHVRQWLISLKTAASLKVIRFKACDCEGSESGLWCCASDCEMCDLLKLDLYGMSVQALSRSGVSHYAKRLESCQLSCSGVEDVSPSFPVTSSCFVQNVHHRNKRRDNANTVYVTQPMFGFSCSVLYLE